MTEKAKEEDQDELGRELWLNALTLRGSLAPDLWTEFIDKLTAAIGMTANGKPAIWPYPNHCGAGGVGQTIVQPITESFIALDTWPDHGGAYLMICSCKRFSLTTVASFIKEYKLEIINGISHILKLA